MLFKTICLKDIILLLGPKPNTMDKKKYVYTRLKVNLPPDVLGKFYERVGYYNGSKVAAQLIRAYMKGTIKLKGNE